MNKRIYQSKSDIIFDAINTTALMLILLAALYPLLYVVSASFSDPLSIIQGKVWLLPDGFTLKAYERVFKNSAIITGYKNTILYTVVGTFVNLLMTIAGAYPLSRRDFNGRNLIMAIITFTMFFGGGMIPNYMVIRSLGLIDSFWVMIIPSAVTVWNLIIMRTFFQNTIPTEMQEAAFIDGCSNMRILVSIVLPLSAPIIAVTVLFYGVGHWNSFMPALIYLNSESRYPLQLILRSILLQNQTQSMMDVANETSLEQILAAESLKYAVIIVASLPVLLLYPAIQKYFVKGVMVGAIKG